MRSTTNLAFSGLRLVSGWLVSQPYIWGSDFVRLHMLRFIRSARPTGFVGQSGSVQLVGRVLRIRGQLKSRSYSKNPLSVAFATGDQDEQASRYRNQKNPIVPSLVNLDVRWTTLDAGQQDDIIAYLEDKMRGSWLEMTEEDKRAAHYVWYGEWGPRAPNPRDYAFIYNWLAALVGVSCLGLIGYKYLTFDPRNEVPGLNYDTDLEDGR